MTPVVKFMSSYIIPIIFVTVLVLSFIRKKDAYAAFVDGSKSAVNLMAGVFPYLLAIMMAVEIYKVSGISYYVSAAVGPVIELVGIPRQLAELIIIRPLSGAGSLTILENIYATHGVDSFVGNAASAVYGSSETVFYVAAIYFSKSNVRNLRFAIPVALLATFVGNIVAVNLCRFI